MAQFKQTSSAKKGGLFVGKSHAEGGIPAIVTDTGQPIEVEGGEAIINKKATALHWEELSKINQSAGGGVPIPPPDDADKVLEKFEQGGKITVKEKKLVFDKWRKLVNMTYTELSRYYHSKDGQTSGLTESEAKSQGISFGRESAEWILKMKKTNWRKWSDDMWKWANKQISFISRMSGMQGDLTDEKGKKTPKYKALLIWGHDPKKKNAHKFNTGGSIQKKSCIEFIKNSEAIKNNGYYFEFKNLLLSLGAYNIEIPKIDSLVLITYNSGGQENLKAIDTINSIELANNLAKLLEVDIALARIIVYDQTVKSKRFDANLLNSINNKNIVIVDRDTIVCTNIDSDISFKTGGQLLKRKDGSHSQRGLWDNIRDNAGSGKEPTKEMLEQEAIINKKRFHDGGGISILEKYIKDIEVVDDEDGIMYYGKFGNDGSLTWIVTGEFITVNTIDSGNKKSGEGTMAIANLFLSNPKVKTITYQDHSHFEDGTSFWVKIGGDDIDLDRSNFFKYFKNKFGYNPDIRFEDGGVPEFHLGGDMSKHLAPNGKPSNLTPEQYKLVRTPAFISWFGNWENDPENSSKVVDDNGEPLVVYHGSNMDFNVFEKSKTNPYAEKQGYFFAFDKKYAESYNSKYVKPFFINIRIKGTFDDDDNLVPFNADGVVVKGLQVEVYDKNNIKLADGTNTTFDENNPDIRFEDGGAVKSNQNYIDYLVDFAMVDGVELHKLSSFLAKNKIPTLGLLPEEIRLNPEYRKLKSDWEKAKKKPFPKFKYPKNRDRVQEFKDRKIAQSIIDKKIQEIIDAEEKNINQMKNENKIPVALISFRISGSDKFQPNYTIYNYADANKKMRELLDNESFSNLNYTIEWRDGKVFQGVIDCEPRSFFKNKKQPFTEQINYFFKQVANYDGESMVNEADKFFFQNLFANYQLLSDDKIMQSVVSFDATSYKNPYELNKAIEKWIDDNVGSLENVSKRTYSTEEKMFIKNYTGYGGLGKFGETTVGSMFEFFTPSKVIKVMWALAYKYGYSVEKSILETSVGTGEFLQFASPNTRKLAYEINQYSAIITKILYPTTEVVLAPFEKMFIKDNYTIKGKVDNLEKFDMVIGNPPYGSFDVLDSKASRYLLGMGEKDYTKANNYVEYFLRRSLDVLKPNGLIVMIVGAELKNGGTMFLDSKESPVKQFLNENAVLLDAYRLPDSTFERTGVTSDILVIQKK